MNVGSHSRREFIKRIGVVLGAAMMARCQSARHSGDLPRDRLRDCWHRLDWLAKETQNAKDLEKGEKARDRLQQEHRLALNELTENGDLDADVADQVQTAFDAAAYHTWRSYAPITCYEPVVIDYVPVSSSQLVQQAELLAESDDLTPEVVAVAQQAIARDVTFLNMPGAEVDALYERLLRAAGGGYQFPQFSDLELKVSPEAEQAAQFLVDLLLKD